MRATHAEQPPQVVGAGRRVAMSVQQRLQQFHTSHETALHAGRPTTRAMGGLFKAYTDAVSPSRVTRACTGRTKLQGCTAEAAHWLVRLEDASLDEYPAAKSPARPTATPQTSTADELRSRAAGHTRQPVLELVAITREV